MNYYWGRDEINNILEIIIIEMKIEKEKYSLTNLSANFPILISENIFLNLIDKHFNRDDRLSKIFN